MPNAIFQLSEDQVLNDHEARLRRLESTSYSSPYNVLTGGALSLLGNTHGSNSGGGGGGFTTSWAALAYSGAPNLTFTIGQPAGQRPITNRTILVLGHLDFYAFGTINSFAVFAQLGVANSFGGAYVAPNSGYNPSDLCMQSSINTLTANSTLCSGTFWMVANFNLGTYNAYFQYSMDSGSTTQIAVAGTPSIAVFALG